MKKPEIKDRIKQLEERYQGVKVTIGVDRLDHNKGLTQKVKGFDKFLEKNPGLKHKVMLIQVAVPSREDVKRYLDLETELCCLTEKVNGKRGMLQGIFHHALSSFPIMLRA